MNDRRLKAVIGKEWLEMRRNKMIVVSMIVLPLALVACFVGMLVMFLLIPEQEFSAPGASSESLAAAAISNLTPHYAVMVQSNDMMMFMLLLVPVILPSYIAAHSVIGEKDAKSLEPLLATPVTTLELLFGKTVAFVIPSTILGWLSYVVVAVSTYFMAPAPVFAFLVRPVWTVGMVLMSPLLAIIGTLLGVLVSSRAKDPRVAQQVSGVVVLPIVGLSMVVMFGKIFVSLEMLIWATSIMAVLIMSLLWVSVKAFQRETILTRWK